MRNNWWKFLGVALVTLGMLVGMLTPLKPGILSLSERSTTTGTSFTTVLRGYNTLFTQSQEQRAWLKLDSTHLIQANKTTVENDKVLNIQFDIPSHLPSTNKGAKASLIVDTDNDGYMVLPEAVFIQQDSIDSAMGSQLWNASLKNLHQLEEFRFPFRPILYETIRNTFYHITLWFAMFILLIAALVFSIKYLLNPSMQHDIKAAAFTKVAILFGLMGVATGSIWARFTWGAFWTSDVKLNMSAIAMLIYLAYLIFRSSIPDHDRRARLSAAYNIFAFVAMIPLIFVVPRLTDSLHPGNGGNPALGGEDMDNTLRMIFYPTIIGFTLLGVWITSILVRFELIKEKVLLEE